jgi:hypothetical protein
MDASWAVVEFSGDPQQIRKVPDDREPHLRALKAGTPIERIGGRVRMLG